MRHRKSAEGADGQACQGDLQRIPENQPGYFQASRAESRPNANLPGAFGDGVGRHSKHADNNQYQRQAAKRSEQGDQRPAKGQRFGVVNLRRHAAQFPKELRIHGLKPIANACGNIPRASRRPNADRHTPSARQRLCHREVGKGPQILFRIALAEICNHANNLPPSCGGIRKRQVIADRVEPHKILLRKSLVDDCNGTAFLTVCFAERAPGQHGDLQG